MRLAQKLVDLRSEPRRYRLTVRARLTLTYAGLLLVAGAIMLTIVYVFIGLVPNYDFGAPTPYLNGTSPPNSIPLDATHSDSATPNPDFGAAQAPSNGDNLDLLSSVLVTSRDDILQLLLVVSVSSLVFLAICGAIVGWLLAGRMLKPLQQVNSAAHRAAQGDLKHRIRLNGPRDEISDLADTFDGMLGSLERSFGTYQRFAANASHELRTPLATSRAMIDVALLGAGEAEKPLLQRLRETNERSIRTVEALLDLAEIDSAGRISDPVNLHDLAAEAVADAQQTAMDAGLTLSSELASAVAVGDPVLLRQLLRNLIENSIRHNTPGGFVRVITGHSSDSVTVTVVNSGSLVAAETVAYLTDPFYRDAGRAAASNTANRGLGLSIVQAIMDRHSGTLRITPRAGGGLIVTAILPGTGA